MKQKTRNRLIVVTDNDPAAFQEKFNEAWDQVEDKNPSYEFNKQMGHCAYIMYTEEIQIPETIEDQYALAGVSYRCRNCPHFEWPMTKAGRVNRITKKGGCRFASLGISYRDGFACEYFYKQMINGELTPIEDDELQPFQID